MMGLEDLMKSQKGGGGEVGEAWVAQSGVVAHEMWSVE